MLVSQQSINKKFNNICLYLLVITTLIGPMIYLRVASLYHFVIFALFLLVLYKGINTANFKTDIMLFLSLWLVEAVISVLWAPDKGLALKYVYYIFLIFSVGILFHCFLSKGNVEKFSQFMVAVLLVCNCVAIWEMNTGNHFYKDYLSDPNTVHLYKYVPGGFYQNPNDFATFIVQILPFSFACIFSKKILARIVSILNLGLSFVTIFATGSRTQIIIIIMMYVFFAIVYNKKALIKYALVLGASSICLYFVYPGFRSAINGSLESLTRDALITSATTPGASLYIRLSLLKNGAIMLYDTVGFGVGAGCHRSVMPVYSSVHYNTYGVLPLHNLTGEIFVDYGVVIGIMFLVVLIKSCLKLFRIFKTNEDKDIRLLAIMLAFSIGMLILCGVSSSSILQLTSIWMTFCFTSAFIKINKANYR